MWWQSWTTCWTAPIPKALYLVTKGSPEFRSDTIKYFTLSDNSLRYQLIPCLPCFELEFRSPIDEISFHPISFLVPVERFSIYIYFDRFSLKNFFLILFFEKIFYFCKFSFGIVLKLSLYKELNDRLKLFRPVQRNILM